MRYLRQSTASTVIVGPFCSISTALALTGLADQSANGRLVKNGTGGTITVASWSHDAQGHYLVGLSTGHTDTVGRLRLEFYDAATYLPMWEDFAVLSAAVYDVLFGATAPLTDKVGFSLAASQAYNNTGQTTKYATTLAAGDVSGNLPADVQTIKTQAVTAAAGVTFPTSIGTSTYAGGAVASVTAGVTVTTNNDKTGYGLSSTQAFNNTGQTTKYAATVATGDDADAASVKATIGVAGAGLTSLAPAATALSTATWTTARAGYLDNANVGGLLASSAEATAIQNNTRVVRVVPDVIERPDSGTTTYRVELLLYDETGNMEAPDSAPTIALVNQAGTDLSARLDSATMALVSSGRYRAIYTAAVADTLEQLVWTFSVVEGGATRLYGNTSLIVDTTAVDFTSSDRTTLNGLATTISGLHDLSSAQAQTAASAALAAYDGPTHAEMDARFTSLDTAVGAIGAASDPWGGVLTTEEAGELQRDIGAVLLGDYSDNPAHTETTFKDAIDGTTDRVTSTQTSTTRTVTRL